jgi:hypothetical protein
MNQFTLTFAQALLWASLRRQKRTQRSRAHAKNPEVKARIKINQKKSAVKLYASAYENEKARRAIRRDEYRASCRASDKKLYDNNPRHRIAKNLRTRIAESLKTSNCKRSKRTLALLGCSFEYLKNYIESRFLPGMSWANRSAWHLDHIKPCALFDLTKPEDQAACFHYSNLQPLWATDNLKKGAKIL